MARLLHPSYFPATRRAFACSYYLGLPLLLGMEAYWRVKKWKIGLSLRWTIESIYTISINQNIDVSAPSSGKAINAENHLVCDDFQTWSLNATGNGSQGSSITKYSDGFSWEAFGFEFLQFQWPDPGTIGTIKIPVTLKIGSFSTTINAALGNQPDTIGSGSLEAIEWWPYRDASGNALYDIATGQPL